MTDLDSSTIMPHSSAAISSNIPVDAMFKLENKILDWGIEGYEVHQSYLDPVMIVQMREFAKQQKGEKDKRHVTKRGSYLDDYQKTFKLNPAPDQYFKEVQWVTKEDIQKGKKKPHNTIKSSYIDQIFKEGQARPTPGVGKYNLRETDQQVKEKMDNLQKIKIKIAEKQTYLNQQEAAAVQVPGPGSYNPHDEIIRLKENRTQPDQWIKLHKDLDKKRSKSNQPDAGTYKPFPVEFQTFGHLLAEAKNQSTKPQIPYLGTEVRFKDPTKSKSTTYVNIPGPGIYPMIAQWPGKDDGKKKDGQAKNWMNGITRGISQSIYY